MKATTIKLDKMPDFVAAGIAEEQKRFESASPDTVRKQAVTHLGHNGMMISGSKSGYHRRYPENVAVFNANICTKSLGKIWYGDIDLTVSEGKLVALAKEIGEPVYVLREMDARFGNEGSPRFDQAVYSTEGHLQEYYRRLTRGPRKGTIVVNTKDR